ncbi:hypothetical protein HYV12_03210 [Candidatus Dojkabacteria bacterium]|nr:hypothetical protein [Candidatus Dojkabacteria bacterium]
MDKSAENFYDLVAIIWGTIGVVGSILSIVIYNLTRKYNKEDKWYINVLIGLGGCILAFLLLMVYSRING